MMNRSFIVRYDSDVSWIETRERGREKKERVFEFGFLIFFSSLFCSARFREKEKHRWYHCVQWWFCVFSGLLPCLFQYWHFASKILQRYVFSFGSSYRYKFYTPSMHAHNHPLYFRVNLFLLRKSNYEVLFKLLRCRDIADAPIRILKGKLITTRVFRINTRRIVLILILTVVVVVAVVYYKCYSSRPKHLEINNYTTHTTPKGMIPLTTPLE